LKIKNYTHKTLNDTILSVYPMRCLTLSRERKGIASWKLAGGKPLGRRRRRREEVTRDPIQRSKVKVTRLINAMTKNQLYLHRTGKLSSNLVHGWSTITCITNMVWYSSV